MGLGMSVQVFSPAEALAAGAHVLGGHAEGSGHGIRAALVLEPAWLLRNLLQLRA